MSTDNKKLGALWKGRSKSEKTYLKGVIEIEGRPEKLQIIIFENNFKKEAKHPDYIIYESKPKTEQLPLQPAPKAYDDDNIPDF